MGQKVNPHGLRVGIVKDWDSNWYASTKNDQFANNLIEDYKIREFLQKKLNNSGVSDIKIERTSDNVKVIIYTAKPGFVLGKKGANIDAVRTEVLKIMGLKEKSVAERDNKNKDENGKGAIVRDEEGNVKVRKLVVDAKTGKSVAKRLSIEVKGIDKPDLDAQLVAENIAAQLENRIGFRRAMKSCMSRTMKAGALGIKTSCSGRLGGADMARTEFYSEGTIPLQTLRADIDYGFAEADTTYGKVGVKTWIYHGEVLPTKGNKEGSDK